MQRMIFKMIQLLGQPTYEPVGAASRRFFRLPLLHLTMRLALSAAFVLLASLFRTAPLRADENDRPNVVVILADDMGYCWVPR